MKFDLVSMLTKVNIEFLRINLVARFKVLGFRFKAEEKKYNDLYNKHLGELNISSSELLSRIVKNYFDHLYSADGGLVTKKNDTNESTKEIKLQLNDLKRSLNALKKKSTADAEWLKSCYGCSLHIGRLRR